MPPKDITHYTVAEHIGGARDITFYDADGGSETAHGVAPEEADYVIGLLRSDKPFRYTADQQRLAMASVQEVGQGESSPSLDEWLDRHPSVAAGIVWEDATGAHAWPSWTTNRKDEIRSALALARTRSAIGVSAVPPNHVTLADDDTVVQVLSSSDAWMYFKASVAQSLALELGDYVRWSVAGYDTEQLAHLFDSRHMFEWREEYDGYYIRWTSHGFIVPAPPATTYRFLGENGLIGGTALETMALVVGWCQINMIHFTGEATAANVQDQWQYRGFPPMTRVIDGTVVTSEGNDEVRHRTGGCHSTGGFLRAALRVVNIPVATMRCQHHAQVKFLIGPRYLTHGDDPYSGIRRGTPPVPPAQIMIGPEKFDEWFGPDVSDDDQANNIGRRPRELMLMYLPTYLLEAYCRDLVSGKSHADGEVCAIFQKNYTVAELEALTLWSRMDAKLSDMGGCNHVD